MNRRWRWLALFAILATITLGCADSSDGGGGTTNNGGVDAGPDVPDGDNRAPELLSIGNKRAVVGQALSFTLEADDPDGDSLTFSMYGDAPSGAKFEKATGRFSWTPTADQVGTQAVLTFVVSDGLLDDRETVEIAVVDTGQPNVAPVLADPGDQVVGVGEPFELRLRGTDEDGDELSYSMAGQIPAGAELDEVSGRFTWTPTSSDEGQSFAVQFVVSDGEFEDDVEVSFVVSDVSVSVADIAPQSVRLGETLEINLQINNPDELDVTCRAVNLPTGSEFDDGPCTFTWTPTDESLANTAVQVMFEVTATGDTPITLVETATITVLPAEVEGPCTDDENEPNNDRDNALTISEMDFTTEAAVCLDDEDWFRFDVTAGQTLQIDMTFEHDLGDLDADLFVGDETVPSLGAYSSSDDERIVVVSAPASETYYLRIYDASPVEGNEYTLRIQTDAALSCEADAAEPNDDESSATAIPGTHTGSYGICPTDVDVFEVELLEGADYRATISFDGDVADLDMELTGPDDFSDSSATISGTEEVNVEDARAGSYFVRVFGYTSADEADYDFDAEVTGGPMCDADASEPNDTVDMPFQITESLTGLTSCGDPDWFRYQASTFELIVATITSDGYDQLQFRALGNDGQTSLGDAIVDPDTNTLNYYLGPIDNAGPVYFVIEGAAGIDYDFSLFISS